MMSTLEIKTIRKQKLDKDLTVKVTKQNAAERIFVEFSSKDGKLVLQRSFQDTYAGRKSAEEFENTFKSIDDLKKHFKVK